MSRNWRYKDWLRAPIKEIIPAAIIEFFIVWGNYRQFLHGSGTEGRKENDGSRDKLKRVKDGDTFKLPAGLRAVVRDRSFPPL